MGSCLGGWKFCAAEGVVWRKGQCRGPSGHPAGVKASRQIWSSAKSLLKKRDRGQAARQTFVELQSKLSFDICLCGKVILMKLRVNDISKG